MRHFRSHNRLDSAIEVVQCAGFDCKEVLFVGPLDERDYIFKDGRQRPICTKCKRWLDSHLRSKRKPPPEE